MSSCNGATSRFVGAVGLGLSERSRGLRSSCIHSGSELPLVICTRGPMFPTHPACIPVNLTQVVIVRPQCPRLRHGGINVRVKLAPVFLGKTRPDPQESAPATYWHSDAHVLGGGGRHRKATTHYYDIPHHPWTSFRRVDALAFSPPYGETQHARRTWTELRPHAIHRDSLSSLALNGRPAFAHACERAHRRSVLFSVRWSTAKIRPPHRRKLERGGVLFGEARAKVLSR